jgi:membrane protein implicated in regulation of membrane protease activity
MMFSDVIVNLGPWNWVIVGLVLLGLEILAPGNVLVWFGLAALVTGGVAFVADLHWQIEGLIFAALAIVFVIVGRRYFARRGSVSEQPYLNQRAMGLVGRTYVLDAPIVNGHGQVKIDDTNWRVTGPDLPSGAKVRVTGADGPLLMVSAVEKTTAH